MNRTHRDPAILMLASPFIRIRAREVAGYLARRIFQGWRAASGRAKRMISRLFANGTVKVLTCERSKVLKLTDAEILERLVALNKQRADEESRGTVRYLRSAYQQPTAAPTQSNLGLPISDLHPLSSSTPLALLPRRPDRPRARRDPSDRVAAVRRREDPRPPLHRRPRPDRPASRRRPLGLGAGGVGGQRNGTSLRSCFLQTASAPTSRASASP